MCVPAGREGVRVTESPLLPAGARGSVLTIGELPPLPLTPCFLFLGSFKFLLYSQQPRKSDPFY